MLYYYLTAHKEFGPRAKDLIEEYSGYLATSTLTAWLLYVLTRLEHIEQVLAELEIELLPLTAAVLRRASQLKRPKDFEDRIHLATMLEHGIDTILSNDSDFDDVGVQRIF